MADAQQGQAGIDWDRVARGTIAGVLVGGILGFVISALDQGPPRQLTAGERVWLPDFTLYADESGARSFVQYRQHVTLLRRSSMVPDRWLIRLNNGNEGWADVPPG